jgi:hypothetical protein
MLDWVGPIRGLWRILDGKGESGMMSDSKLRGGCPHPCWLRTDHLAPENKFDYLLMHAGYMGSHKPSSLCNCLVKLQPLLYDGCLRENEVA